MKIIIYGFIVVVFFLSGCSEDIPTERKDIAPLVQDDDIVEEVTPRITIEIDTVENNTNIDEPAHNIDINELPNDTNDSRVMDKGIVEKDKKTVETKATNWYIRIIAEDVFRGMKTKSAQLGEIERSDAVQTHTLKAFSPFGSTYLDVVFVDPDGVDRGAYKTNFHRHQEETEGKWQFTVKTDDNSSDITLTWRGLYVLTAYIDDQNRQRYTEYRSQINPLMKYMKLIDTSNGNEIAAVLDGEIQTYHFNMDGQTERTFEWLVQMDEVVLEIQKSSKMTFKSSRVKKDARMQSFDLNKPPIMLPIP